MKSETAPQIRFPLAIAPSRRHLVDQSGTPVRLHGDTAWSLVANLTLPEIEHYLADRKARGFNAILVNLLEHRFALNAPANRAGDYPFLEHEPGAYDFSTPNEAYFSFVDGVLDRAAAGGFTVLLSIMYLGAGGGDEGWWKELNNRRNHQGVCHAYGRFLGARYKDAPHIVWVIGGDYTPPAGSNGEQRLLRIYDGIRAAGATQLATTHASPDHNSDDWKAFRPSMQLLGAYGYGVHAFEHGRAAYAYQPAVPAFYLEGGYEAEGHVPGDPASVRAYAWWGQLTTIGGGFYGHRDVWPFQTASWSNGYAFGREPWTRSLDAPAARAMSHMAALLSTLAWHTLVPAGLDGMKHFVTVGAGEDFATVAAAANREGTLALAYLPTSHVGRITLDLTVLSGPARARWWDPSSGRFIDVGPVSAHGSRTFTRPGTNAAGAADWLLVLDR